MPQKQPNIFIEPTIPTFPKENQNNGISGPERYWRENSVVNPETEKFKYWQHVKVVKESRTWLQGAAKKGRLEHGYVKFDGTKTIHL